MYGKWVVHTFSASTGRLRQEDCAFKACLGYIGRPHLNKKTNKQIRVEKEKKGERQKTLLQKNISKELEWIQTPFLDSYKAEF